MENIDALLRDMMLQNLILFLLKDKSFPITKQGMNDFSEQYQKVHDLILDAGKADLAELLKFK